MSGKPVILSRLAALDVDNFIDFYLAEAGDDTTLRFIAAFEDANRHIAHYPDSGSVRYAAENDSENLRAWRLSNFPQMIFYVDRTASIYVWRVLHGNRDIARSLRDDRD